jgi:hypothetical protein
MSGLDDLVAEAMQRKLIVSPTKVQKEPPAAPTGAIHRFAAEGGEQVADDSITPAPPVPSKERAPDSVDIRRGRETPDASFAFTVNGVKCVVTIHVEPGATLALSDNTKTAKKAPSGGVKVKGIRGATPEVAEAPEPFIEGRGISSDNLPEGWVNDPVVGATPGWTCPDHGLREERTSQITGRQYIVCPTCGKLAPR